MSDAHESDAALAEPIVTTQSVPRTKQSSEVRMRQQPPYHVIILNDEVHSFEYVTELLMKLFGHPLTTAEALTWRIHLAGRAVVLTTHKEKAELKRDQVLAYGNDPAFTAPSGPLGCYIEPAATD